jgi:hypothetical protein
MSINKTLLPSTEITKNLGMSLSTLDKEPMPYYAVLGLEFIVHAGSIRRIKTKREVQCQIEPEVITKGVYYEN